MTSNDNEIDLLPFIFAIVNRWKAIVVLALLAALLGLTVSLLLPAKFEATATILLTRSRATLALADQFPTVSEPIDNRSRMDAIIAIASSSSISVSTYEAVKDRLPDEQKNLRSFRESLEISTIGDAFQIKVTSPDPQVASDIANTWSAAAVAAINQAYGEEQPIDEIFTQLEMARTEYQAAQASLEQFIEKNRIEILTKQRDEATALLENMASDRAWRIRYYTDRKQNIERIINELEALQLQVEDGNSSVPGDTGDALAILYARAIGVGTTGGERIALEIQDLSTLRDNQASYVSDLSSLIDLWESEKGETEKILAGLAEEVIEGAGVQDLEEVTGQISMLERQLEIEQARDLELRSERDLAWEAYQALAQKEVELRNTPQYASIVTLASNAIAPLEPTSRGVVVSTIGGGGIGFIIGLAWVIVHHWWQATKERTKAWAA